MSSPFIVTRGRKPAVAARPQGFEFQNIGGIERQVFREAVKAEAEGPPAVVLACQEPGAQYMTPEDALELSHALRKEALAVLEEKAT